MASTEDIPSTTLSPPPSQNAEVESYTIVAPRKVTKKAAIANDDEPLIDLTEALDLKSKKISRKKKQQQKKLERFEQKRVKSDIKSFLELPPELLHEVLIHLLPSDIIRLSHLNRSTRTFIFENESSITRAIIQQRYWVLSQCFPSPIAFETLDPVAQTSLLTPSWQNRLILHTKPYPHIRPIDKFSTCTCMTCVMSWNDLCTILDLAHFQPLLNAHQPLPLIPRGTNPVWNTHLASSHAALVEKAIRSPLHHALILQLHLATIVATLMRPTRWGPKKTAPPQQNPLYRLSESDVQARTDEFLERPGPTNYEPLYFRENYNHLKYAAYVPNRRWEREEGRWVYPRMRRWHAENLAWVVSQAEKGGWR